MRMLALQWQERSWNIWSCRSKDNAVSPATARTMSHESSATVHWYTGLGSLDVQTCWCCCYHDAPVRQCQMWGEKCRKATRSSNGYTLSFNTFTRLMCSSKNTRNRGFCNMYTTEARASDVSASLSHCTHTLTTESDQLNFELWSMLASPMNRSWENGFGRLLSRSFWGDISQNSPDRQVNTKTCPGEQSRRIPGEEELQHWTGSLHRTSSGWVAVQTDLQAYDCTPCTHTHAPHTIMTTATRKDQQCILLDDQENISRMKSYIWKISRITFHDDCWWVQQVWEAMFGTELDPTDHYNDKGVISLAQQPAATWSTVLVVCSIYSSQNQ